MASGTAKVHGSTARPESLRVKLQVRYSRSRRTPLVYRIQTLIKRKTCTLHEQCKGCATRKFRPIPKCLPPGHIRLNQMSIIEPKHRDRHHGRSQLEPSSLPESEDDSRAHSKMILAVVGGIQKLRIHVIHVEQAHRRVRGYFDVQAAARG